MPHTLHSLKTIPASLLPRIAEIHLGDAGLLSKLGYPFVLRYFEGAIKDDRAFGFYAQDDGTGEIMGFSLASPEPSALTSKLTEDKGWFIQNIIKVIFTRPAAFLQMAISSITIRGQMYEPNTIECVYFTVDPTFRGRGLGRSLQKALMDEGRKQGYKKIYASVETWNIASLKATQANGFRIIKTFREGIYHRHRLESEL
ncbi:MAG: GNAT family N-acetyltransferase [Anaerolineales bacterium]|jgi:RimJ/RimL family protein N-acetyltransferase|uniref:GNAT family N-acetyltransferase n=1 Tax=Candidatus Villigracilis vicinus TaxID=3140679 RepID=UPI0031356D32|nr:GNAT family N-acetyltransferase [Anaerolineales bacterium]MBK9781578.1 GNAT family N-acetyltransferase [Anaerolineales bacterium]